MCDRLFEKQVDKDSKLCCSATKKLSKNCSSFVRQSSTLAAPGMLRSWDSVVVTQKKSAGRHDASVQKDCSQSVTGDPLKNNDSTRTAKFGARQLPAIQPTNRGKSEGIKKGSTTSIPSTVSNQLSSTATVLSRRCEKKIPEVTKLSGNSKSLSDGAKHHATVSRRHNEPSETASGHGSRATSSPARSVSETDSNVSAKYAVCEH
jgi:hypothetical protein